MDTPLTRRRVLAFLPPAAAAAAAILAACGGKSDSLSKDAASSRSNASASANPQSSTSTQLKATPACGDVDDVTPEQTEGPYFTRNSPERMSLLEAGASGTKLALTGVVLDRSCKPVAKALVDFWQADD